MKNTITEIFFILATVEFIIDIILTNLYYKLMQKYKELQKNKKSA